MSKAKESTAAALANLDAAKGQLLASSEKNSDQLRKVRDRAKKKVEALRQLEVTEKAEHEAVMVKIVDEHKKVIKRITAKEYW